MSYEIVDADYVLEHLGKMPILDVRPKDMYLESRIPGALSAPLLEAKEAPEDTTEFFLREVLDAGIDPTKDFIVYCYDGGLAREACDLLENAGNTCQKCYAGSWVEWISDSSRPVEK